MSLCLWEKTSKRSIVVVPSLLTRDLQTEPKKGSQSWCGYTDAEYLVRSMNESYYSFKLVLSGVSFTISFFRMIKKSYYQEYDNFELANVFSFLLHCNAMLCPFHVTAFLPRFLPKLFMSQKRSRNSIKESHKGYYQKIIIIIIIIRNM